MFTEHRHCGGWEESSFDFPDHMYREGDTMTEQSQSEVLSELLHRMVHLFVRVHHHRHRQHGHQGMHPGQARVLGILADAKSMSQREVQDMLHVRSASLSELLHKLERGGYVIRERDEEDRRNVILSLTREGKRAFREHAEMHRDHAEALFSALDESEQKDLETLLTKLLAAWRPDERDMPHGDGDDMPGREGCRRHGHRHHDCDHGHDGCERGHEHGHEHGHGRGRRGGGRCRRMDDE